MQSSFFRFPKLVGLRWRRAQQRSIHGRTEGAATKVDDRKLAILAHHLRFQHLASASVLAMLLLIAPSLGSWPWLVLVGVLMGATLVHNRIYVKRVQSQLRREIFDAQTRIQLFRGIGFSTFLWGLMTWPLDIGQNLDFMSFLIVTIVLFSICLAILSAGFQYRAMASATIGGALSLGAKVAWLTPAIGPLLPLGFAIFIITNFAYGLVIEHQTHGGVLLELRSRRTSANLARVNAELAQVLEKTQQLANLDPLTQLRNRSAFERTIAEKARQFANHEHMVMLLDIDHFKSINDRFGHQTGDGVLIAISTTLEQWENDAPGRLCARWGGEEFIAFVALRRNESITAVAENLRQRIEALGDQLYWPDMVSVTTSIGCARLNSPDEFSDALRRADDMLYSAKEAGRNRWRLAA